MADSSKPTVEDATNVILTENDVPAAFRIFFNSVIVKILNSDL